MQITSASVRVKYSPTVTVLAQEMNVVKNLGRHCMPSIETLLQAHVADTAFPELYSRVEN